MTPIDDLPSYLAEHYQLSVFDDMEKGGESWVFHLHQNRCVTGRLKTNKQYEVVFVHEDGKEEEIPKLSIKFLYLKTHEASVKKAIKFDRKVQVRALQPILTLGKRHHIKNKTLFPLLTGKTLLFFTTLEGEIIGGVVGGFTKYEITVLGKRAVPVTLLRHAVFDVRDQRNKCYLKRAVEAKQRPPSPRRRY